MCRNNTTQQLVQLSIKVLSHGNRHLNVHGPRHCLNVKVEYRRSKWHCQGPELSWLALRLCLCACGELCLTHKGGSPALYNYKVMIILYSLTFRMLWPFGRSFSLHSSKFTIGGDSAKRWKTFYYKNKMQNLGMRYCIIMNNEKQTSRVSFNLIWTVVPYQTKERCCNIFIKHQRPLEVLHCLESARTKFLRGSTRKQKFIFAEVSSERQSRQRKGQGGELVDCLVPEEGHGLIPAPKTVLSEMETEPVPVYPDTSWFQGVLLPSLLFLGGLGALPSLLFDGHQTLSFSCLFSPQMELCFWNHLVCLRLE